MRLLLKSIFLLSMGMMFTGCFEIIEEVDMKTDGTGTLNLTINMSESKENLKNYMTMDDLNGIKIPKQADIEMELRKIKETLEKTDGISNVTTQSDFENFVFKVNSDFKDTDALNKAINKVVGSFSKSPIPIMRKDNFASTKSSFSRLFGYKIKPEAYNRMDFGTRFVLETARLSSIYSFENPVKKMTNADAVLSANKQEVSFKTNLAPIVKGEKSIVNEITF